MPPVIPQKTQDLLDELAYEFDWIDFLAPGETISSAIFTVTPSGLTTVNDTNSSTNATIVLTGGVLNVSYLVTCQVVTTAGNTVNRSMYLRIVQR